MFAAAFHSVLPAWLARSVHVPSANIVTLEPLSEHVPLVRLENVGLNPDDAVAETAKAVGLYVRFANVPNVID